MSSLIVQLGTLNRAGTKEADAQDRIFEVCQCHASTSGETRARALEAQGTRRLRTWVTTGGKVVRRWDDPMSTAICRMVTGGSSITDHRQCRNLSMDHPSVFHVIFSQRPECNHLGLGLILQTEVVWFDAFITLSFVIYLSSRPHRQGNGLISCFSSGLVGSGQPQKHVEPN